MTQPTVEFHRQKAGEPWRSMILRIRRLRVSASARADYAIFMVQIGRWHRSLEVGWRGYVRGFRVLP